MLRRPPLGHVLATAHDMAREHRVLSALHGTAVPVPEPLALCEDAAVTGAPFYVMEFADGLVVRTRDGRRRRARRRPQPLRARAMIDVLADLHAVDPDAVGLADFGRPEGFMARQVRRWGEQLDASAAATCPGVDELRSRLAASGAARAAGGRRRARRLPARQPRRRPPRRRTPTRAGRARLGDGDAGRPARRPRAAGRVLGGSRPLPDVGGRGDRARGGSAAGVGARGGYAERSGRDVSALPWYVAFGYFKIAVILEGIHYRFVQGQTVGAGFDRIGEVVPPLVALGLTALP